MTPIKEPEGRGYDWTFLTHDDTKKHDGLYETFQGSQLGFREPTRLQSRFWDPMEIIPVRRTWKLNVIGPYGNRYCTAHVGVEDYLRNPVQGLANGRPSRP